MSFNFKGVEAAKPSSYLKPGRYRVRVSEVTDGKFEQSGIPYVEITFQTQDKLSIAEKFVLKSKEPNPKFNPISRLVYLHEAWLGEGIDQDFKSPAEIAAYFKKALMNKKAGAKTIVVGGEVSGKIVYGRIPLAGFIETDADVELGEFTEGDENWAKYVRKSNRTTAATGKKGGLLNDDDDDDDFDDDDDDAEDDVVEEKAPEKKTSAKKAGTGEKKPAAKKTAKKEEAPEKEEDDDDDNDDEGFAW